MQYEPNKVTVSVRTGEPLEEELRNRGVNQNEQAELNKAIKNFKSKIETTPEIKCAFDAIRKMSMTLHGKFELHTKEKGVMGALECPIY